VKILTARDRFGMHCARDPRLLTQVCRSYPSVDAHLDEVPGRDKGYGSWVGKPLGDDGDSPGLGLG